MKFIKGIVAGAVIGAIVGIAFDPITQRDRRHFKKSMSRMVKQAGSMMDNVNL